MPSTEPPDFDLPLPSAEPLPAADVQVAPARRGAVVYKAFPVRQPEADVNDFVVEVRASTLERCRGQLGQLAKLGFPWHEVALGVSTLAFGALLGALQTGVPLNSANGVLFYCVAPSVGAAAAVAFWFLRKRSSSDAAGIAKVVLQDLPDPERAR